jgi:hypothetical protein
LNLQRQRKKKLIHTILADNEFESTRQDIAAQGIKVNITAKEEHIPQFERQSRVIKEGARAIIQRLPYEVIPHKIRIGLVQYKIFWLNNIPKTGHNRSPRDLIFGLYRRKSKEDNNKKDNSSVEQLIQHDLGNGFRIKRNRNFSFDSQPYEPT